jgi:hypothetical protein
LPGFGLWGSVPGVIKDTSTVVAPHPDPLPAARGEGDRRGTDPVLLGLFHRGQTPVLPGFVSQGSVPGLIDGTSPFVAPCMSKGEVLSWCFTVWSKQIVMTLGFVRPWESLDRLDHFLLNPNGCLSQDALSSDDSQGRVMRSSP